MVLKRARVLSKRLESLLRKRMHMASGLCYNRSYYPLTKYLESPSDP